MPMILTKLQIAGSKVNLVLEPIEGSHFGEHFSPNKPSTIHA
jgi:hypothetical protein